MNMKKLTESLLAIEPVNVNDISLKEILTAIRESREGREEPEGRDR
jgi:wobble nucleotide-excising tRNase